MDDLSVLISQVSDSLTFNLTHASSLDMKPHLISALEGVSQANDDQRRRIDHQYGPMSLPSPSYVERELLFLFRAETSSVDIAKDRNGHDTRGGSRKPLEPNLIDRMSDDDVKIFKKEIKQRIHEWEGAFRAYQGRDAGPQDKFVLRPIYELYKITKNRICPSGASTAAPQTSLGVNSNTSAMEVSAIATGALPIPPSTQPPSSVGWRSSESVPHTNTRGSGSRGSSSGGGPGSGNSSVTNGKGPGINTLFSVPSVTPSSQRVSGSSVGQLSLSSMSHEEVLAEKRRLKRRLHSFESDFAKQHGRPPTKEDRNDYAKEYHRYAELKTAINER
eukprot:Tbor_TRINITY_DN3294_c0_g1::TRINITY_DN3294_c0_g1_i1::g.23680::m.23680